MEFIEIHVFSLNFFEIHRKALKIIQIHWNRLKSFNMYRDSLKSIENGVVDVEMRQKRVARASFWAGRGVKWARGATEPAQGARMREKRAWMTSKCGKNGCEGVVAGQAGGETDAGCGGAS